MAWHPLGWQAAWYSEIEPFPCAVLKHHYLAVPNYGDMTKFMEWPDEPINLLVGGTPCQSFSVAGLRKGLADPRGNLMLIYGAIARRYRPEWLVWENVPGVLSSDGGRDFGTFLGMLAELGYGFAYRVLDAQYFGVAQRRRRVFVVANARSWQRAAAVLFESHSLQGHPAPSRETTKDVAGTIAARFGSSRNNIEEIAAFTTSSLAEYRTGIGTLRANGGDLGGGSETLIAKTLTAGTGLRYDFESETLPVTFGAQMSNPQTDVDMVQTLQAKNPMAVAQPIPIQEATGRSATSTDNNYYNLGIGNSGDPMFCLTKNGSCRHGVAQQYVGGIDYENNAHTMNDATGPLLKGSPTGGGRPLPAIATAMQVRRLTPVECERLQGFSDNYTDIPWRNKPESPDGPRYKALGNSMAVPVMAWIGNRIQRVSEL